MNLTYVGDTYGNENGTMATDNYLWVSSGYIYTAMPPVTLLVVMPAGMGTRLWAVSDSLFWTTQYKAIGQSYIKKVSFNGSAITELLILPNVYNVLRIYATNNYVHLGTDAGLVCYDSNGTYLDTAAGYCTNLMGDSTYIYAVIFNTVTGIYYLKAYLNNVGSYTLLCSQSLGTAYDTVRWIYATENKAHVLMYSFLTQIASYKIYGFNGSVFNLETSVNVHTGGSIDGKIVVSNDEYALVSILDGSLKNVYKIYLKSTLKYSNTGPAGAFSHIYSTYYWSGLIPFNNKGYFGFDLGNNGFFQAKLYEIESDQFDTTTVNWIP